MSEIKIKKGPDGTFHAHYDKKTYKIHNSSEAKQPSGLLIKVDTSNGSPKTKVETGNIEYPCLQTRFELAYEGQPLNIEGLIIEKSSVITSKNVHVLRGVGSADYRTRVGNREQNFYFIIENCMASLHIEETQVKGRKLYYLVVNNMV